MRPRMHLGTLSALERQLGGLWPTNHSIVRKFRVDLELITPEEYLGVLPVFCVCALEGQAAPMSSSG